MVGGDVGISDEFGEHAAGLDGAELLVVADEHGPPVVRFGEPVVGEESGGVDHAGFVDHDHRRRARAGTRGAGRRVGGVRGGVCRSCRLGCRPRWLSSSAARAVGASPIDVDAGGAPGIRRQCAACVSCPTLRVRRPSTTFAGCSCERLDGGGLAGVETFWDLGDDSSVFGGGVVGGPVDDRLLACELCAGGVGHGRGGDPDRSPVRRPPLPGPRLCVVDGVGGEFDDLR